MSQVSPPFTVDPPAPRPTYVRAVSPRLRKLLYVVFALVALLAANASYLASITALEWWTGRTYQNYFYQYMFLAHLALGLLLIVPFVVFGVLHMLARPQSPQSTGCADRLCAVCRIAGACLISGLLLMRIGGFDLKQPGSQHGLLAARRSCRSRASGCTGCIGWPGRGSNGGSVWPTRRLVAALCWRMIWMHSERPAAVVCRGAGIRCASTLSPRWHGPSTGDFIPAHSADERPVLPEVSSPTCTPAGATACTASARSTTRPIWRASTRRARSRSSGTASVQASRWCAGCHDPVPFFSGAFDDPKFDMLQSSHFAGAGITCTVCHAITHVNSTRGNADYTIEEPLHYPFAYSDNPVLQWINNQLVKAKPRIPQEDVPEAVPQDGRILLDLPQGASAVGAEPLQGVPPRAEPLRSVSAERRVGAWRPQLLLSTARRKTNCNRCHMPLEPSTTLGQAISTGPTS